MHGMCHPLEVLKNKNIDVVVCAGMGARAVQKLNEDGIRAYKAVSATAEEIIERYKKSKLEEIPLKRLALITAVIREKLKSI